MHTIVGRLTADAEVKHFEGDKSVVNFTVAVNDYYRQKGSDELKQETTYYDCAYWRNANAADRLKKGTLVELSGKIGARGYIDSHSDVKGQLTLRVDSYKVHQKGHSSQEETTDDLPDVADYPTE